MTLGHFLKSPKREKKSGKAYVSQEIARNMDILTFKTVKRGNFQRHEPDIAHTYAPDSGIPHIFRLTEIRKFSLKFRLFVKSVLRL